MPSLHERIRGWVQTNILDMPPDFQTTCDACGKTITREEVRAFTDDKILGQMRYWCKDTVCREKAIVGVPGEHHVYPPLAAKKKENCGKDKSVE